MQVGPGYLVNLVPQELLAASRFPHIPGESLQLLLRPLQLRGQFSEPGCQAVCVREGIQEAQLPAHVKKGEMVTLPVDVHQGAAKLLQD